MKYTSQKDRQEYISVMKLAAQLPDEEKARLSRDLMSEVRRSRLEKLQTDVRDTDLSDDEIRAEVEYVRQTMYMERRGDEDYSGYKSVD
ncbi:MAG TPA: hypothetical protein IAB96_00565 [Candidatus Coprenecus pullicola]|nr:hypothetical protein [Candidatus Coprenecus pullicola]